MGRQSPTSHTATLLQPRLSIFRSPSRTHLPPLNSLPLLSSSWYWTNPAELVPISYTVYVPFFLMPFSMTVICTVSFFLNLAVCCARLAVCSDILYQQTPTAGAFLFTPTLLFVSGIGLSVSYNCSSGSGCHTIHQPSVWREWATSHLGMGHTYRETLDRLSFPFRFRHVSGVKDGGANGNMYGIMQVICSLVGSLSNEAVEGDGP